MNPQSRLSREPPLVRRPLNLWWGLDLLGRRAKEKGLLLFHLHGHAIDIYTGTTDRMRVQCAASTEEQTFTFDPLAAEIQRVRELAMSERF